MLSKIEVRDLTRIIQLSSVMSLVMDDPEEVRPDVLVSRLSLIIVHNAKNYTDQQVVFYLGLFSYSSV